MVSIEFSENYFNKNSYQSILDTYNESLNWLTSIGIKNIDKSRLVIYRNTLSQFIEANDNGRNSEYLSNNIYKLSNAFCEMEEINLIHKGLKLYQNVDILKRLLQEIVSGPEKYELENVNSSSNRARNISFELLLASTLISAGLEVELGIGQADIEIINNEIQWFIECKRPFNTNGINSCVKSSFSQLRKRFDNSTFNGKKRGLIAISLNKIINPDNGYLTIRNFDHLETTLNLILSDFIETYDELWQHRLDIRVVGVICHLSALASIQYPGLNTTCQKWSANNTLPENFVAGYSENEQFKNFIKILSNGMEKLFNK